MNTIQQDQGNSIAAFILTNGRPDKVITYNTLRNSGFTGRIVLVVDNLDPTLEKYRELYGQQVVVFDKRATAKKFDIGDNFDGYRGVVYARNACHEIAEKLGIRYYIQLDDDYAAFYYTFDETQSYIRQRCRRLDKVFASILKLYIASNARSIALAQAGDFIGGASNGFVNTVKLSRKCMNSFFCSTDRPFKFVGRINEDVNAYIAGGSRGLLFLTTNCVALNQITTQHSSGGMTGLYLDQGTYVKSMYSVVFAPSSMRVALMGSAHKRLHHLTSWNNAVPKIVSEAQRKPHAE